MKRVSRDQGLMYSDVVVRGCPFIRYFIVFRGKVFTFFSYFDVPVETVASCDAALPNFEFHHDESARFCPCG